MGRPEYYILEGGRPRPATLEEWEAWSVIGGPCMAEPYRDRTALAGRGEAVVLTRFLTEGPLLRGIGPGGRVRLLPWLVAAIGGPESGHRIHRATLAEARKAHWALVDRYVARGYRIEVPRVEEPRLWA